MTATRAEEVPIALSERRPLERLEWVLGEIAGVIAIACVTGMLFVAAVTMADVILRWFANEPIPAINEIVEMTFSVAISACLPAGMAKRVNLKIDLVARYFSPGVRDWLEVLGSACMWLFYGVLAWRIFYYAATLAQEGRTTVILGLPQAPFMYAVSALMGFATLVQTVIIVNETRHALRHRWPTTAVAAIGAVAIAGGVALWAHESPALSAWAQTHIGLSVTLVFIIMWLMTLILIPIAAIMGIVGVIASTLFIGLMPSLGAASTEVTGFLGNSQLATLPLFLMMGSFAAVANIAEDAYRLAYVVLGRFRGGLGLTTIAACAGFGALTGHSMATTVTIGKVALPEMQSRGYSAAFSTGCCAGGGTLGSLLPPASGPLILFALLSEASVGQLFVAALLPGLLATALYLVTIVIYVHIWPDAAPLNKDETPGRFFAAISRCGPAAILFGSVLGGIYMGVFTATEAAAVGAFESFLCALWRGRLKGKVFWHVMAGTTASTAMIYGLIFGAQIFSFFVGVSALTESATAYMSSLNWAPIEIIALIILIYLVLGSLMESFAVMVITVPIVTPLILHLGYDILWWGIINLCVVETGLIHPPLGLNVFILKSIQPDVPMWTIYKGVFPFVIADLVKLVLLVAFPAISLWLVSTMGN